MNVAILLFMKWDSIVVSKTNQCDFVIRVLYNVSD